MNIQQKIEKTLRERLNPGILEVINESHKHAGHMGDDGSGESHFKIIISSENIIGNSRLEKHRTVMKALDTVMPQIHALQIIMQDHARR